MKIKKKNILGRHSAYLTENIIMLFVLLVIVSVSLVSFMKVQKLEIEGQEQLMANVTAQNLIEYGKATHICYSGILMNIGAEQIGEKYYFYYDSDWKQIKEIWQCTYIEEVVVKEEQLAGGILKRLQVNVYKNQVDEGHIIYSLSARAY